MKFTCLAILLLSATFEAGALNMRHRHHGHDDDGNTKVVEKGDVTTTAGGGAEGGKTAHEPNPWCGLCEAVDGVERDMDNVPKEREDELVDTVISGRMPCGALEYAGHQHVFTEDVCTTLQTNVGATCCSMPVLTPPEEQPEGFCDSDDDCTSDFWCRHMEDDLDSMKQCVPFLKEGEVCSGYAPIHMYNRCGESLACIPSDQVIASDLVDTPGTCVKVCSSDDDCDGDAWCRNVDHYDPHCSPYRIEGESCSEYALLGVETKCDPSLECSFPEGVMDAPGTCVVPSQLEESRPVHPASVLPDGDGDGEESLEDAQYIDGPVEMICTGGSCTDIPDECRIAHNTWYDTILLQGPDTDNMDGSYWMLEGCSAACQGCVEVHMVGYSPDEYNCNSASGMTWCPELEECVRPWETNCSFEDDSSPLPGEPGSSCSSDSECTPEAWCKPMDYDPNGMKQCVLYLKEEESCNGYGLLHTHTKCGPSLVCARSDEAMINGIVDFGTCVKACSFDDDCAHDAWCRNVHNDPVGRCLPYRKEGESCSEFALAGLEAKCDPSLVCSLPGEELMDAPGACVLPSPGTASRARPYPPCVDHKVVVDCDHPDATDTDTTNPVTVVLLEGAEFNEVASTTITGFCQQNGRNQYVETVRFDNLCANADGVDLYISGHDAIFIDRVRLYRDDHLVKSWGENNGLGWCLSEDPKDYNQGPKDWSSLLGDPFGVTCVESIFFEYNGLITSADMFDYVG